MIDLTDSCFKSQDQEPGSLFQRTMHMGEMNTGNNRLMYEFVCKREGACDGFIFQCAQNMMEAIWQLGRKRFYRTL